MDYEPIRRFNTEENGLKLSVQTHAEDSELLTVLLKGSLDTFNSTPFSNTLFDAFDDFPDEMRYLILDLSELTYISSTGIGSLTNLLVYCKKNAIRFYLMAVQYKVMSVLKMLGFTPFFNFIDKTEDIDTQA